MRIKFTVYGGKVDPFLCYVINQRVLFSPLLSLKTHFLMKSSTLLCLGILWFHNSESIFYEQIREKSWGVNVKEMYTSVGSVS